MLQIKNLSKYSQKKYFFNIITKYKRGKSDFYLFLLYLVLTLINFYIYWSLEKTKKCMTIKKNQSSTKQKKEKISVLSLIKSFIQKTKIRFCLRLNQKTTIHLIRMKKLEYPLIYPLIKLEGFISIYLYLLKKKLDSRIVELIFHKQNP